MTFPSASWGKAPTAPSLRLLRWLRHCVADESSHGGPKRPSGIRADGAARNGRNQEQQWAARQPNRCSRIPKDSSVSTSTHWSRTKATQHAMGPLAALKGPTKRYYSSPTEPLASAAVAHACVEETEDFVDDYFPEKEYGSQGPPDQTRSTPSPLESHTSPRSEQNSATTLEEGISETPNSPPFPTMRITKHLAENPTHYKRPWVKGNADIQLRVSRLRRILRRNDDIEFMFEAYTAIPAPRIKYMPNHVVADLLCSLRRVQWKSDVAATRYFDVMDDMVRSGISPSVRDFTSALVHIGRADILDPNAGLDKALYIFNRMQQRGAEKANIVTFNTLGDLALRARRFDLFRKILKQVSGHGLHEDRFTCLLKIRYWGLLKNSNHVKRTYREMIAAGHLIDTTVLNCVIRYLILANDATTAEKTFERMKEIAGNKSNRAQADPPEAWNQQQQLAKILQYSSWLFKKDSKNLGDMQTCTPTGPNTYTYRLIIRYHCLTSKNLHRVVDLLEEMQQAGMLITRPIFFIIFAAFATTSPSEKFSPWNASQLDSIFKLMLGYVKRSNKLGQEPGDKYDRCCQLNYRLVEIILKAYAEHDSKERVRRAWSQLRHSWKDAEASAQEEIEALVVSIEDGTYLGRKVGQIEISRNGAKGSNRDPGTTRNRSR